MFRNWGLWDQETRFIQRWSLSPPWYAAMPPKKPPKDAKKEAPKKGAPKEPHEAVGTERGELSCRKRDETQRAPPPDRISTNAPETKR